MSKAVLVRKEGKDEVGSNGGGVSPSCAQVSGRQGLWGDSLVVRSFDDLSCVWIIVCMYSALEKKKKEIASRIHPVPKLVHEQGLKTGWFSMSWQSVQLLFLGAFFGAPTAEGEGLQYVSLVTVAPRLRRPKKEMCLGLVF